MKKVLVCQRCGRVWTYTGKAAWYTACPNCKTSVNIKTRLKRLLDEQKAKSNGAGKDKQVSPLV